MSCERVIAPEKFADSVADEWKANCFSRLIWHWLQPLLKLGFKRPIEAEDLGSICINDSTEYNVNLFRAYQVDGKQTKSSIRNGLFRPHLPLMVSAGFCKLVGDLLGFVQPFLLSKLLDILSEEEPTTSDTEGYLYALGMFLGIVLQSVCLHQHHHLVIRAGMQAKNVIVQEVFHKSLSIPQSILDSKYGGSKAVNLQSQDSQKIEMAFFWMIHYIWAAPLQCIIALVFLYLEIGAAAFAGFAVLLLIIPGQRHLAKILKKYAANTMEHSDARIKIVKEAVGGVKLIKLNAFENKFIEKITDAREEELKFKKAIAFYTAANRSLLQAGPVLVAIVSFVCFAALGGDLTASKAFTALSLFEILRLPLLTMPWIIRNFSAAQVALQRLTEFLLAEEHDDYRDIEIQNKPGDILEYKNAAFSFGSTNEELVLKNVNVKIPRGALTLVFGKVGAGKTAFLLSLLGEIHLKSGSVVLKLKNLNERAIAYCSQTPFILNATLRENILMGEEYDESRYKRAIWASALAGDIESLPTKHETEIGERGVTLSGGQKARISLARALYRNCEIYVLDAILSAVDGGVKSIIVRRALNSVLKKKTVILATHEENLKSIADCVLTITKLEDSEGASVESSIPETAPKAVVEPQEVLVDAEIGATPVNYTRESESLEALSSAFSEMNKEKGKLMKKEHRDIGVVKREVYKAYLMAFGICATVICSIFVLAQGGSKVASDWWLGQWSVQAGNQTVSYYVSIYAGISGVQIAFILAFSITFAYQAIVAARVLHEQVLNRLLSAPMVFFDQTPAGIILNRMSNDVTAVDEKLPEVISSLSNMLMRIIFTFIVQIVILPWITIGLILMTIIYLAILEVYRRSFREINRISNITKSPIYSRLSETIGGVSTLRSYGEEDRLLNLNAGAIDGHSIAFWKLNLVNRYLGFRLDSLGAVLVLAVGCLIIMQRDSLDGGLGGLVLTYSLSITTIMNWFVRQTTEFESSLNAVERLLEYTKLDLEDDTVDPVTLKESWPQSGDIQFNNVQMRYRPELPFALNGVSITIENGSKLGVCGRTGSGKSSLIVALFRMRHIEPSGSIIIDGVDISKISLYDLRSRIFIVPQDPLLFAGSLRYNIDPLNQYTDAEIWHALDLSTMKDKVSAEGDMGLESMVQDGGSNYSNGERQLICLARILLRKSVKIVALDEATSSLDNDTDQVLQRTIKTQFANATSITIAHRLDTITSSDKIAVMDDGKIVEYGVPSDLMQIEGGKLNFLLQELKHVEKKTKIKHVEKTQKQKKRIVFI